MTIIQDDILHWAETYDGPPFHALICDPPYHLTEITRRFGKADSTPAQFGSDGAFQRASRGFMGKTWDGGDIAYRPETWAALARHLYPGAFGMAFAGSRGWHRMAVAIEDAGLIIHPTIFCWSYGSGFPKATRIDTQVDRRAGVERQKVGSKKHAPKFAAAEFGYREKDNGYNSKDRATFDVTAPATDLAQAWAGHRYGMQALKPAVEPIIVFQKPYEGRPVDSITTTGAGALWIDGGRIEGTPKAWAEPRGGICSPDAAARAEMVDNPAGRWPANLCLVHHPACEPVGVKRVRNTSGEPTRSSNGYHGGIKPGAKHADPDGYESIPDWRCHPACPARRLGEQSGESASKASQRGAVNLGMFGGVVEELSGKNRDRHDNGQARGHDDTGTAARFFFNADYLLDRLEAADPVRYEPKADRAEREAGLDPRQVRLLQQMEERDTWASQGQSQTIQAESDTRPVRATTASDTTDDSSLPMLCDGCKNTARSQKATKSTTATATSKTTGSRTSSLSTHSPINGSTADARSETANGGNHAVCAVCSNPLPQSIGISLDRDGRSTESADSAISVPLSKASEIESFRVATINDGRKKAIDNPYQRGETERRNLHPCIKPLSLTRWLATLLLPPERYAPRRILVPFAGAASEMVGALLAGWEEIIGIELEVDHCRIAEARMAYWRQRRHEFLDPSKPIAVKLSAAPAGQLDLFDEVSE